MSLVSQALMAIALNGEKERISVHEEHVGGAQVSAAYPRSYSVWYTYAGAHVYTYIRT